MCRDASKQCAGWYVLEQNVCEQTRRKKRRNSKPCQSERMSRQMQHRLQKFVSEFDPVPRERFHQAPVSTRVLAELLCRKIDIAIEARRGAIIERMRQWYLGLNPLKTKSFQRERREKRRPSRSEERRVGKECRSRWSPY